MSTRRKLVNPLGLVNNGLYTRTLRAVNALRVAHGKSVISELPAGEPNEPCNCPIAKALKPIGVTSVRELEVEFKQKQLDGTLSTTTVNTFDAPNAKMRKMLDVFSDFVNEFDDKGSKALSPDADDNEDDDDFTIDWLHNLCHSHPPYHRFA